MCLHIPHKFFCARGILNLTLLRLFIHAFAKKLDFQKCSFSAVGWISLQQTLIGKKTCWSFV